MLVLASALTQFLLVSLLVLAALLGIGVGFVYRRLRDREENLLRAQRELDDLRYQGSARTFGNSEKPFEPLREQIDQTLHHLKATKRQVEGLQGRLRVEVHGLRQQLQEGLEALARGEAPPPLTLPEPPPPDDFFTDAEEGEGVVVSGDGQGAAVAVEDLLGIEPDEGADPLTLVPAITEDLQEQLYALGIRSLERVARLSRSDARRVAAAIDGATEEVILDVWVIGAQAALYDRYRGELESPAAASAGGADPITAEEVGEGEAEEEEEA